MQMHSKTCAFILHIEALFNEDRMHIYETQTKFCACKTVSGGPTNFDSSLQIKENNTVIVLTSVQCLSVLLMSGARSGTP